MSAEQASATAVRVPPENFGARAADTSQQSGGHTAQTARLLDIPTVLALSMGWFFSVQGVILVVVCVMLIVNAVQRANYSLQDEPRPLTPATLHTARHYDFVELTAPLDYSSGVSIHTTHDRQYTLTPVADSDNRFVVYERGSYTGQESRFTPRPLRGRIVAADWTGEWDVDGSSMNVVEQFERQQVAIPEDALVLVVGDTPEFLIWQTLIGVAGLGVVVWFCLRLGRTLVFLRDRGRLAVWLNRTLADDDDEARDEVAAFTGVSSSSSSQVTAA